MPGQPGRYRLSLLLGQETSSLPWRSSFLQHFYEAPYMWLPLSLTPQLQPIPCKMLTSPALGRQTDREKDTRLGVFQ